MTTVKIRFTRPYLRYDRGQIVEVDQRLAERCCRDQAAVIEKQQDLLETAVVEPADLRTADATPKRRRRE
jgi:hypothetical protein